jgi:hypothetical protein
MAKATRIMADRQREIPGVSLVETAAGVERAADIAEAWASRPEARQDYDDLAEEDTS